MRFKAIGRSYPLQKNQCSHFNFMHIFCKLGRLVISESILYVPWLFDLFFLAKETYLFVILTLDFSTEEELSILQPECDTPPRNKRLIMDHHRHSIVRCTRVGSSPARGIREGWSLRPPPLSWRCPGTASCRTGSPARRAGPEWTSSSLCAVCEGSLRFKNGRTVIHAVRWF